MYIVIECHGGPEYAIIVTNEDGLTKVFDTLEEAEAEAADCQDGRVVEIGDDTVKVDLNHPLAGEDLHFKGEVLSVRVATADELDHGHVHGEGGHHHH